MKYVYLLSNGDKHIMLDVSGILKAANKAAGTAAVLAVKEHFVSLGGRRYYGRAARMTQAEDATEDGVTVNIHQRGIALHYWGGTVKATGEVSEVTGKPTKSLLIPGPRSPLRLRNKSLAELGYPKESVHVIKSRNGKAYLVADSKKRVKLQGQTTKNGGQKYKKKDSYVYLGALRKQATIHADKGVLPSDETWSASLGQAVRETLLAHKYVDK